MYWSLPWDVKPRQQRFPGAADGAFQATAAIVPLAPTARAVSRDSRHFRVPGRESCLPLRVESLNRLFSFEIWQQPVGNLDLNPEVHDATRPVRTNFFPFSCDFVSLGPCDADFPSRPVGKRCAGVQGRPDLSQQQS